MSATESQSQWDVSISISHSLLRAPFVRRKLIACQLKSIRYHRTHESTSYRAINAETMSFEIWGSLQHDTPPISLGFYNKLSFSISSLFIVVDNDDNVNEHLSKLLNQLTAETEKKKDYEEGKWERNAVTDNRRRCLKYRVCAIISTYTTCCCMSFLLKQNHVGFFIKRGGNWEF